MRGNCVQIGNNNSLPGPISVGTGLVALDWLLIGRDRVRPNEVYAGGSCGNVMAILAFMGWQSYPIARLGRDHRAETLIADLQRCNVQTQFLLRRKEGATPVIIVRMQDGGNGTYRRRYEWKHPASGDWLPRYRPVPKTLAELLGSRLPNAKIFYFDRAEPSSLVLATLMRERGAVVFFEPSSARNLALFSSCLAVSDIVKYAAERLPEPPQNPACKSPRMEIQTFGPAGLRFRLKLNSHTPGPWRQLPAYRTGSFADATGCGDWCSAGLIDQLCQNGREEFLRFDESDVVGGLRYGQALAAINCRFMGARGPMYSLSKESLIKEAKKLVLDSEGEHNCKSNRSNRRHL